MTKIKFCGMTRNEDALAAAELGVNAIGLIFYSKSPRAVDSDQAKKVIQGLPASIIKVGVFVNASFAEVKSVLDQLSLDWLQFHGNESPEFCRNFHVPYIKVVRMKNDVDFKDYAKHYHDAKALLLDAYLENTPGGTGKTFAWNLVPKDFSIPIILAGGLKANNVRAAIAKVHPDMVDVVSGIEATPGIKDYDKMAQFVDAVKEK